MYSRRGEPQLAPNRPTMPASKQHLCKAQWHCARPEAMRLVKDMAQAVQERNADQFHSAAERYVALTCS